GAEVLSRVTDYTDRSTCILFGDRAGRAVVERGEDYPAIHAGLGCRADADRLYTPGVNTDAPPSVHMARPSALRYAVEAVPRCISQVLEQAGLGVEDVDRYVFHQANQRIIDLAMRKLHLPPEKCTGNIAHTGNTSAASVPLLLDELVSTG